MSGAGPTAAEQALRAARARGAVDAELLDALAAAVLLMGVEELQGSPRPLVREVGGRYAALAWTTAEQARAGGWTGPTVERAGRELAALLAGTGLLLAVNAGGQPAGVLEPGAVQEMSRSGAVPAGTAVYLGQPDVPDEVLETALTVELRATPEVSGARLSVLVADPPGTPRLTVVLSLRRADQAARRAAFAACDRVARAVGRDHLDAVVDDDLGGLREAALQLPDLLR